MTDLPFGVNKFGQAVLSNCTVKFIKDTESSQIIKRIDF